MQDVRPNIVALALEAVNSEQAKHEFHYDEVRPLTLTWNLPWYGDCSWFVKTVYWKAGCTNDPTGHGWNGWGNTIDLYWRGRHITQAELLDGDVVVFGPEGDVHGVIVVETGPDPICASMGREGDPNKVPLSVLIGLGEPTFLRFDTSDALLPHIPPRAMTLADLRKNQLTQVPNPADAHLALKNGWNLFTWDGYKFVSPHPAQARGTHEYANVHYRFKRP